MFEVEITPSAVNELGDLRPIEGRRILAAIEEQLNQARLLPPLSFPNCFLVNAAHFIALIGIDQ